MVRRRAVTLIAVLVLGAALGGCLGGAIDGGDDGTGEDGAGEVDGLGGGDAAGNATALAEAAAEATSNADSYTATGEARSTTAAGQQSIGQTVEVRRSVDNAERRQSVEQTVSGGLQGSSTTTESYLLDQTQYVRLGGSWESRALSRDPWENGSSAGNVGLLAEYDVTRVGTETVDGVETAVLEVDSSDDLREALAERRSQGSPQLTEGLEIQAATLQYYVGLEAPHYVHRVETNVTTRVAGPSGQTFETQVDTTTNFDDYDEDVTVDVPDAVEELRAE